MIRQLVYGIDKLTIDIRGIRANFVLEKFDQRRCTIRYERYKAAGRKIAN